MKNLLFLFIAFSIVFSSCNNKNELSIEELVQNKDSEALIAKRVELAAQQTLLGNEIREINKALELLNPTKDKFVTLYQVKDSVFNHYIEQQGTIEAINSGGISPESQGILRLYVKEGDSVRKGSILGRIDGNSADEMLKQAQINLDLVKVEADLAEVTFKKQEKLWEQKIGSEISFLQAKARYQSAVQSILNAEKQVAIARTRLQNQKIFAPYDGVVEKLNFKSGQFVSPQGPPIIELVGANSIKVTAKLPEKYLASVRVGMPVVVEIPSLNQTLSSKISLIGSSVDLSSRTFKIEVPIQNKEGVVKPNLVAKIKINDYSNQKAVVVPSMLVLEDSNGEFYVLKIKVEKAKDGKKDLRVVRKNIITKGLDYNGLVEVKTGLSLGDSIINDGRDKVSDKDFVQIIQ